MNRGDLAPLINAWLDGRITEAESARLQEMLRESPAARIAFRRWTRLDTNLREQSQRAAADTTATTVNFPRPKAVRFRLAGWLAAAAALVALAATARLLFHERGAVAAKSMEQTNLGCAILTRAADAAFADGTVLRAGDTIKPGPLKLTSGAVQVEFFSGASMLLQAGASLELVSPWEAVCLGGRMTVRVPPPAHGFKLRTAGMELVDLGTEFGVNVDAMGGSEVHVFEGKVEAHPESGPARLLHGGQSLRRDAHNTLSPGDARPDDFPSIERINAFSESHAKGRYDSWWHSMQEVRRDPRLLACYLFKHLSDDKWNRLISNFAEPRVPDRAGGAVGARWAEGRWPMKDALEFKSPGDRVRINLGNETCSAITLACWARVDGVDRKYNALLLTDGYDSGEPHWQIYEDGSLMFSIAYPAPGVPDATRKKNNQIYFSPRIFDLAGQRRWHHIAVTYDSQSGAAVQYLDGREISREISPFHQPGRPIVFGPCEIGNWGLPTPNHQFPIRNLNGRIDEFLVYKAALASAEITALFESGKPE